MLFLVLNDRDANYTLSVPLFYLVIDLFQIVFNNYLKNILFKEYSIIFTY